MQFWRGVLSVSWKVHNDAHARLCLTHHSHDVIEIVRKWPDASRRYFIDRSLEASLDGAQIFLSFTCVKKLHHGEYDCQERQQILTGPFGNLRIFRDE